MIGQFVLLFAVLALGFFFKRHWHWEVGAVLGGVLLVLAGILGFLGLATLRRNLTPFPRPRSGATLVQTGIYALIRHPLYSSLILVGFGWALIRQSGPALLVAVIQAVFLNAKATREEHWLRQRFPEYADYQKRVHRLIPWIW